ncbi:MAG: DUF819 family protein, partial [Clostridia bacterium]|nr:DUF819 family protein [Clostridia bacterium]
MQLVYNILIVLVILLGPRLMVLLSRRFRLLGALGPVFLCYALGVALSLVIPDTSLAMSLSEVLVPVAIPLILFSANLMSLRRLAKPMLFSFLLMAAAVFLVSCVSYGIYRGLVPDMYKYAGMIIGLYTGGTPNLMAIGVALDAPDSGILLANASDVVVGGIYFLLLISVMPRLVRRCLKPFAPAPAPEAAAPGEAESLEKTFVPEKQPFSLRTL